MEIFGSKLLLAYLETHITIIFGINSHPPNKYISLLIKDLIVRDSLIFKGSGKQFWRCCVFSLILLSYHVLFLCITTPNNMILLYFIFSDTTSRKL